VARKKDSAHGGDDAADATHALERTLSVAVVKADQTPVVEGVMGAVNILAAAISVANPAAGAAMQSVAVLGGWAWNKWKFDRVRPVLEEVTKRVQRIENDYVRREEFADMLWDALRRLGDQPDPKRRELLRNIIFNAATEPKDHTEHRRFLRLADELSWEELRVFLNVEGPITRDELLWTTNKVLALRGHVDEEYIDRIMLDLANERLFDRTKFQMRAPHSGPGFLLTPTGADFRRFLRG
jgi:hypothetical protein